MSPRCSICRLPERGSIDVSLLRDGTRLTARNYGLSRSALHRHRQHITPVAFDQSHEIAAGNGAATPLISQLELMIRQCEDAVTQAKTSKDFPGVLQAIRELRAHFELKCRLLQSQEQRHRGLPQAPVEHRFTAPGAEASAGDPYENANLITLRLQIRSVCHKLGQPPRIAEPTNVQYLAKRYAEL